MSVVVVVVVACRPEEPGRSRRSPADSIDTGGGRDQITAALDGDRRRSGGSRQSQCTGGYTETHRCTH